MALGTPKVGPVVGTGANTDTSLAVTMPTGVVAGDLLELTLGVVTASATVDATLAAAGFALPGANFAIRDDTAQAVRLFKIADAADAVAASKTATVSGHNGRLHGQIIARPGAGIPANADGATGVLATSTPTYNVALTLAKAGWVSVAAVNRSIFTYTAGAGLVERGDLAASNTGLAVFDSGAEVTAGAVARTLTASGSSSAGAWQAYAVTEAVAATSVQRIRTGGNPATARRGNNVVKLYRGTTLLFGPDTGPGTSTPGASDTFELMVDEPNPATNVGLGKYGRPAEAQLTPQAGTFTVTSAMSGQTIENLNISRNVIIDAGVNEVHFVNCLVRGVGFTGSDLIKINAPVSANITFDFCEMRSDDAYVGAIGVGRDGMVVRRCYIHHLTDTVRVTGNDTVVEGNALGPLLLRTPDIQTRDDNKTHSDVIQFEGGARARVRGNKLFAMATTDGTSNVTHILSADPFTPTTSTDPNGRVHPQALSALMFTPNVGAITDFVIEGNWVYGGEIAINAGSSGNSSSVGSIINNKFDRNQWYPGHTIDIDPTGTDITTSGNVYMDNGAAVTVRRNA